MSGAGAINLLFVAKCYSTSRYLLLATGLDIKKRDVTEGLYALYIFILVGGAGLALLSYAVVRMSETLSEVALPLDVYAEILFYLLALWLALVPYFAQSSYDLYRFSLPDLEFLSTSPISPAVVGLYWFAKSLFSRWSTGMVVGCGILAGSLATVAEGSDLLGLVIGLSGAAAFFIVAQAWLWVLGLLRYHLVPKFGRLPGLLLTATGLLLLLAPTVPRYLFWPAHITSELVVYGSSSAPTAAYLLGLLATVALGIVALYFAARGVWLAPAFEEGRLGGQLRRSVSSGEVLSEARTEIYLTRMLAQGRSIARDAQIRPGTLGGVWRAILHKQRLRLARLSPAQAFLSVTSLLGLGAVLALGVALSAYMQLPFQIAAPGMLAANFWLIRFGMPALRSDLAHLDFFVGWPTTRLRLMQYNLLLGFGPPLLSGIVVLLLAGLAGLGQPTVWLFLGLWPLMVAVTALAAFLEMLYLLRHWPGTPETLPDTGLPSVLVGGLTWLALAWYVPISLQQG